MGNCLRRGEPSDDYSLLHSNSERHDHLGNAPAHQIPTQVPLAHQQNVGSSGNSGSSSAGSAAEFNDSSPENGTNYSSLTVERQISEDDQRKLAQRFGLIQHLPSGLYDGGKKDRECPICMVELNCGDPVRFLPCMHVYHKDCIDDWLLKHSLTCPNCMEPVDSALLNSYEVGRTPWEFS